MQNLNLGSGKEKLDGFVNIDINLLVRPDTVADIRRLPFKDNQFKIVTFFHTIEHMPEHDHIRIFSEIYRVLEPNGVVYISYPEFVECAKRYISNEAGNRDFWKMTIFGRQRDRHDFHCTLMDTRFFLPFLLENGFKQVRAAVEPSEPYNTVLCARKKSKQILTDEVVLREEVLNAGYGFT